TGIDALHQLPNRRRLIARRLVASHHFKWTRHHPFPATFDTARYYCERHPPLQARPPAQRCERRRPLHKIRSAIAADSLAYMHKKEVDEVGGGRYYARPRR